MLLFLSKNKNNNGFGAIGLSLFLVNRRLVANIHITFVFLYCFFLIDCFRMSYILHNEHHLAAQIGTFSHANMRGRLCFE